MDNKKNLSVLSLLTDTKPIKRVADWAYYTLT